MEDNFVGRSEFEWKIGNYENVMLCEYITLRHFIHQLHLQWPLVHQQNHSSSLNASLKRCVFNSFLKVSVFVSSWRLDGREFHAFGPENEKLRSPNFSFNCGSLYHNWFLPSELKVWRDISCDLRPACSCSHTEGAPWRNLRSGPEQRSLLRPLSTVLIKK